MTTWVSPGSHLFFSVTVSVVVAASSAGVGASGSQVCPAGRKALLPTETPAGAELIEHAAQPDVEILRHEQRSRRHHHQPAKPAALDVDELHLRLPFGGAGRSASPSKCAISSFSIRPSVASIFCSLVFEVSSSIGVGRSDMQEVPWGPRVLQHRLPPRHEGYHREDHLIFSTLMRVLRLTRATVFSTIVLDDA
jgi:hypothetical protein